jgi:gluconolactonase
MAYQKAANSMRFFVLTNAVVLPIVFFCSNTSVVSAIENVCNLTEQGTDFDLKELTDCDFVALDPLFFSLLEGTSSSIELLLENDLPIFHEGPVLFDDALYFTSNRLGNTSSPGPTWGSTAPAQLDQFIHIYRLDLATNELSVVSPSPDIVMANGMTKTAGDGKNILVLSQGFNDTGGVIYELDPTTLQATPLVSTFYGTEFNALNDIKVTNDGIIFFTDPVYGFEQGFRTGNPLLGSNVYRYDTKTKTTTLLITGGLQRPNGLSAFG